MSLLTNREDFQGWRDSPMTQAYLAYLKERQTALASQWSKGLPGSHLPEPQAQAVLLGHLASLQFEDIEMHYQIGQYAPEPKEPTNEEDR